MNSLNILSSASVSFSDVGEISRRPSFRKATRNMILATAAIEKAILPIQSLFSEKRADFGLVLVSNSGELETTIDFLQTLSTQKVARPLLFQNSLHNATAGFLSIHMQLQNAVISSSSGPFAEENALQTADLLISSGHCQYCLVVSVDVWPRFDGMELKPSEDLDGSTCFVFSKTAATAKIQEIVIQEQPVEKWPCSWQPSALSANILYCLEKAINQASGSASSLEVEKSGYGTSRIKWTENPLGN